MIPKIFPKIPIPKIDSTAQRRYSLKTAHVAQNSFSLRSPAMLANRLIKSCLFMFVVLAPVAAKASFVIDDFDFNNNVSYTLGGNNPGGVTGSRNVFFAVLSNAGGTGTLTKSLPSAITSTRFVYNFSSPLVNTGNSLGGNPTLNFNFLESTGVFSLSYRLAPGGPSIGVGTFGPSATPFSLSVSVPSLLTANYLRLDFDLLSPVTSTFKIDSITATPEPTSMILFGSVMGAGFFARRRLKGVAAT
jgi:hypothetical protein